MGIGYLRCKPGRVLQVSWIKAQLECIVPVGDIVLAMEQSREPVCLVQQCWCPALGLSLKFITAPSSYTVIDKRYMCD